MKVHSWPRWLAWLLCVTCALGGCHSDDPPTVDELRVADVQADLDALIDQGLEAELPPRLAEDELIEVEVRLHRSQVGNDMVAAAAGVMAPLAVAAAMFAPEGAVDLVLTVMPVHKLGKAMDVASEAFRLRRRNKRSQELVKYLEDFQSHLSKDAGEFLRLASRMSRDERRAIGRIFKHTQSTPVIQALARKHVDGDADVRWIAGLLNKKDIDKEFVRRFTFDADLVEEITGHEAHISWRVLQAVVENTPVDDRLRDSLADKIKGLMGERAAMQRVRSAKFTDDHFQNTNAGLARGQGMRYGRGMRYGSRRSIDIVAADSYGNTVFVEVKNYAAGTWNEVAGQRVLDQLDRHDLGILEIQSKSRELRRTAGKVLMVTAEGIQAWEHQDDRAYGEFMKNLERRGWKLEVIPSDDIPDFQDVIDGLR